MPNVYTRRKSGGIGSITTNSSTYSPLAAQIASRVIIQNAATGSVALTVQQDGAGSVLPIPAGGSFTLEGLSNASQIAILATTGTPAVAYRWEH